MLQIGTLLEDRFLIEQLLAQGGMGAVYLATDQKFGSRVAIKERFYEHAELAEAFEREARILNSLHHPVLPHVSDYFSGPGGHFLVMEYIEGEDLSEMLKREGSFPVEDVTRWGMELLDTLDYLHSQDPPIIHRDIKPGNLKLTSRGNIVLLDFGLAKETTGNTQGMRSVFGYSRRYSPLEQIEGAGTDVRSDIFSLAATLYHLMTGEAPVDVLARASAIVGGRPDPLLPADDVKRGVPVALADVLTKALELDPDKRFASAADMRSAVEKAVSVNDESVTDVLPADFDEPVEEETLLAHDLDEIDDTVPVAAAGAASVGAPIRIEKAEKYNKKRAYAVPLAQRPALWVGVLVLALLAIGYAGLRMSSPTAVSDVSTQQPAVQPTVEANPEQAQAETVAPDETEQTQPATVAEPEQANTTEDEPPHPEVAVEKRTIERPIKRDAEPADDEVADNVKTNRRSQPQPRESQTRNTTSARRQEPVARELPERPRIVRRRDPSYGPPASSIEMIFTGIPPERRRRWRRMY